MPNNLNEDLKPESRPPLADKVAGIDEKRWLNYQMIGGVILGAAASAVLYLVKSDGSLLSFNFIIALAIVKFLPDYLEKQMGRSLNRARIAMVVMMVAAILGYAGYILLTQGSAAFTAKP